MKISPIPINQVRNIFKPLYPINNLVAKKTSNLKKISNTYYPVLNFKGNYSYTPVANIKPIFEPVGHYDNLDKFCKLFAQKINSQLLAPTESDIENLIKEIQFKTKASEKEVKEVLYNLTAFSGYQSFDKISNIIKKYDIKQFGLKNLRFSKTIDSLSNYAIDYLIKNKKFANYGNSKFAFILDNQTLTALENMKKSSNDCDKENYKFFIENIDKGNIVFLNLKGWDIKTKQNGYKSANFLTGSGYLKDLAIETINSLKSGKSESEIYYSDFKERLYKLTKHDIKKEKLQIEDISPQNKTNITSKDILDNLKPKTITKEQIKAYIKSYLQHTKTAFDKENISCVLLKYLDEMTRVYSIDSLAVALKNLHEKIKQTAERLNENENNLSYIIPDTQKSFSIISAMYALVNNLSQNDFNSIYMISDKNKDKTKVVLDDVSGSGTTERKAICNYKLNQDEKIKIIYAPVILCKKALTYRRSIYDYPNAHSYEIKMNDLSEIKDLISESRESDGLNGKNVDYSKKTEETLNKSFKILTKDDLETLFNKIDTGFDDLTLSVAFPYMIPDNCSDLASLILKNLLYAENEETNKPFKYYKIKECKNLMDTYKNIDRYAKELISSGKV